MIAYFARHPTAANLLMAAILLIGIVSLPKFQRDTFPTVAPTEVEIRVPYPGATPTEVEEAICLRIEDALDSVTDRVEVRCEARENQAVAIAQMREGGDYDTFFNDVKSSVEAITGWPDTVEKETVSKVERVAVVASIAITGIDDPVALKAYAEAVKGRIRQDPGIAQVQLFGFSDHLIDIAIRPEALYRLGLGVADIAAAIRKRSIDQPSGVVETSDADVVFRFKGARRTVAEFADLIIATSPAGGTVRLGDVASIVDRFELAEDQRLFNGKRAAILEISKTTRQDALRVRDAVARHLEREVALAPPGVSLEISQDVTTNIYDRLYILGKNGIQGLALVFLVMWAFFSFRYSFWVAMGLPVSFLGAVFAMLVLGYTINTMTMVALIVAIGLLMDDAIVISENIAAHIRRGRKPLEAAVEGARQVLPGVVASFLTTVLIVGPLAFMSGRIGAVLKVIPVILVVTLTVSLIEAFLILPAHLYHSLNHMEKTKRSRFHAAFDRGFDWLRDRVFGPLVDWSLRWRYLNLGLIAMLLMVSFATIPSGLLKYRAFPNLESDIVQARILLPQGTPMARTEALAKKLVDGLHKVDAEFTPRQPGGENLVRNILVLYGTNVDASEKGPHVATVSADLLRAGEREGTIRDILKAWRSAVGMPPDVIALNFTDRERGVAGNAIDIRLSGNDLDNLKAAATELKDWFLGFEGITSINDDLRLGKPEFQVSARADAGISGITAEQVASELRAALHGNTGIEVRTGVETYDVRVRLDTAELDHRSLPTLLRVSAPGGTRVPIASVADIGETRGYARIHRVNGARTVTVQGAINGKLVNSRELMAATKKRFLPELKKDYPDVRVSFVGQGKESAATTGSMTEMFLVGLALVYVLLSYQFRGYVVPLIVLAAIPLGLVGMVWGHLALGLELSLPSLIGLATLAGVVVNNSILLVTFIRERIGEGMDLEAAAHQAARDRFRAVVLTSLTTIAGLLPLLTETSTQAQFLIPLVASLAFGLLAATMLTLMLIPSLYVMIAGRNGHTF